MIPQHVACMILTHLPMITWDHDLTIIARHRAQPRWPLLLATNSRLRHLALAAMKDSGIGLLVNSDKIAPKMQNILCLYPASLKSIEHSKQHSTSSTKLSSKPRVSDENIWKHSIELCLLATATHILRSYAAMQQAFSAVLPWNKHIFESLVWAKGPHDLSSSGGHLTQQISTRHSDTFDMIHFDLWWPIHVFCS